MSRESLKSKPYPAGYPLIESYRGMKFVGFNRLSRENQAKIRARWFSSARGAWQDPENWAFCVKADGSLGKCPYREPMRSIHDPDVVASLKTESEYRPNPIHRGSTVLLNGRRAKVQRVLGSVGSKVRAVVDGQDCILTDDRARRVNPYQGKSVEDWNWGLGEKSNEARRVWPKKGVYAVVAPTSVAGHWGWAVHRQIGGRTLWDDWERSSNSAKAAATKYVESL